MRKNAYENAALSVQWPLLQTYVVGTAAAPSAGAASTVAVLAGRPLSRGGVGILPTLAGYRSDGIEHLRGHVGWEGTDCSSQVWSTKDMEAMHGDLFTVDHNSCLVILK